MEKLGKSRKILFRVFLIFRVFRFWTVGAKLKKHGFKILGKKFPRFSEVFPGFPGFSTWPKNVGNNAKKRYRITGLKADGMSVKTYMLC